MSHNFDRMFDTVSRRAIDNKVNNITTQKWASFFSKSVDVRGIESILLVTFRPPGSRAFQWWPVVITCTVWPGGPESFSHCPNSIFSF